MFLRYTSIFQLRAHKNLILEQVMKIHSRRFKIAHLREVELKPEHFLNSLAKQFGLQSNTLENLPPEAYAHSKNIPAVIVYNLIMNQRFIWIFEKKKFQKKKFQKKKILKKNVLSLKSSNLQS